jgi:anaerobic magnesium-protoporphyrin IX monomethyl ester cyclase
MKKLDILLVNPSNRMEQFADLHSLTTIAQPVGLSSIAAFLKKNDINVEVFDAEANNYTVTQTIEYIKNKNPMIMGISAFTTKMHSATNIIQGIKDTDIISVIGGHHSSAIPEQALNESGVDYLVRGEGYTPLLELCKTYKAPQSNNSLTKAVLNIPGLCFNDIRNAVPPHISDRNIEKFNKDYFPEYGYSFLDMSKYRAHHWQTWGIDTEDRSGFAIVYASLGCPFQCDYCTVNLIYGSNRVRYKDPTKFVSEIEYLNKEYGTKYFEITDDTFTFNKDRVLQICNQMIKKGLGKKIHAWCFGRVSTVNKDILYILRESGVDWIFFGFESSSEDSLKGVNKKQTVDQMFQVRELCSDIGINVGGNFLFGLPEDTHQTMKDNLSLAKDLNCEYVNFFLLMAYPGTKYYEIAKEKGYPLPKSWNDYGFFAPGTIPMTGKNISARDIVEFRDRAFVEYFSSKKYQNMIKKKFGQQTVDFINNKILSKSIKREILC